MLSRILKDLAHIEVICNFCRTLYFGESFAFEALVEAFILFIQKMTDLLQDCDGIRSLDRVLAVFNQPGKQFIHVGHVEVSRQHQVSCLPVVGPDYRVQITHFILPEGPVT